MINSYSILAIIPARGGSKGIPGKNIHNLAGKPLLAYTIEEAQKSLYIDRLILSSEDAVIIETEKKYGCEVPFERPAELAQDDTPGIDPVIHAIETLPEKYDYIVLLQPTSPLRIVGDIDGCIELCVSQDAPSCVSICPSEVSPFWMYQKEANGVLRPLKAQDTTYVRRQDLPAVYSLNGAVYVAASSQIINQRTFITDGTVGYVMPRERSADIDEPIDLKICELILGQANER